MPEKAINLEQLADKALPPEGLLEKGSFLQNTGRNLFYAVLIFTALVIIGLFAYLIIATPSYGLTPSTPLNTETSAALIQERQVVFSNFITGIEKIVIAFCLPILTAILGYLFGTRDGRSVGGR